MLFVDFFSSIFQWFVEFSARFFLGSSNFRRFLLVRRIFDNLVVAVKPMFRFGLSQCSWVSWEFLEWNESAMGFSLSLLFATFKFLKVALPQELNFSRLNSPTYFPKLHSGINLRDIPSIKKMLQLFFVPKSC